jgi:hypothetical protein
MFGRFNSRSQQLFDTRFTDVLAPVSDSTDRLAARFADMSRQ